MTWWLVAVVVILVVGALAPLLGRRKRDRLRSNDEEIAARSRYNQLGFYVDSPPTASGAAAGLLARARERWNSAGSILAGAHSEQDFELAEQIAEEGMTLVREAYAKLGKPL